MIDLALYMTITGGGMEAISFLTKNGGASNFFYGASIPYGMNQLNNILKTSLEFCPINTKTVSANISKILSTYSLDQIEDEDKHLLIGIGATSSLKKENERKERINQSFITICTSIYNHKLYDTLQIVFSKNLTRYSQEFILSQIIIDIFNSIDEYGNININYPSNPDFSITYD